MREFEVKSVELKTVAWSSGWHRYALRCDHASREAGTDLVVDDVVLLSFTQADLWRLRDALDRLDAALAPKAPPWMPPPPKPQKPKPANTGKPWAPEDDAAIVQRFGEGASAKELADALGRSAGAVQLRLVKLGLVEPKPNGWRGM